MPDLAAYGDMIGMFSSGGCEGVVWFVRWVEGLIPAGPAGWEECLVLSVSVGCCGEIVLVSVVVVPSGSWSCRVPMADAEDWRFDAFDRYVVGVGFPCVPVSVAI